MENLKCFIDTHDKEKGTFPKEITPQQLKDFYIAYEKACKEEGVISVKTYAGLTEGRAFCINMAPSKEAIFRVHEKVGLAYDSITEVNSFSPVDIQ